MKYLPLFLVLVALPSCGGGAAIGGVAAAVDTTLRVVKEARAIICTTALDPLMGDPRAGQPIYGRVPSHESPDAATESDGSAEQ